ncbi:HNH endonuclease [Aquamicrobium zhengzhouense]|uniref:HNH endonuclease n=1 Tax=Aquamicrobium zhengzhouense TaxID=2781738 RepID=UPI0018E0D403|nr:HNH endonuclease [Aquamicrobium zhengzhouense]
MRTETCSYACSSAMRSVYFAGVGNPNYRGRNTDTDGYRIYVPGASGIDLGFRKSIKMHHAVAFIELGITSLPKATHVHHRDCDALNNDAENLALFTEWDHKWLHKQFGVAPLIAFMRGNVDLMTLSRWSDDPPRAEFLLKQNVVDQGRELREMGGYSESNLESVLMGYRWHDPFDNPMAQIIIRALNLSEFVK